MDTAIKSMQQRLSLQANCIEAVFASQRIYARVWGGRVLPAVVIYDLTTAPGMKSSRITGLTEELALALGVDRVRIYRRDGKYQVEVPRARRSIVSLRWMIKRLKWGWGGEIPFTTILGLSERGENLLLKLGDSTAHVLIAGLTGCGKTMLLRCMLLSLAMGTRPKDLQMVLIGPQESFRGLKLPHLMQKPIDEPESAGTALCRLLQMLDRRRKRDRSHPRIVIAIDELADLIRLAEQDISRALVRLTSQGRSVGMHLIGCTQRPAASEMQTAIRANFGVRIVGKVAGSKEAALAAERPETQAHLLAGSGDFLLFCGAQEVRFQAPLVPPKEAEEISSAIRARLRTEIRAASLYPEPNWKATLREMCGMGNPQGGRKADPIPTYMVQWARDYQKREGHWPSAYQLQEWHQREHGVRPNHNKARRALLMAQQGHNPN